MDQHVILQAPLLSESFATLGVRALERLRAKVEVLVVYEADFSLELLATPFKIADNPPALQKMLRTFGKAAIVSKFLFKLWGVA